MLVRVPFNASIDDAKVRLTRSIGAKGDEVDFVTDGFCNDRADERRILGLVSVDRFIKLGVGRRRSAKHNGCDEGRPHDAYFRGEVGAPLRP